MTDPLLGPGQQNGGGLMFTHMPQLGSPAIDLVPLGLLSSRTSAGFGAACRRWPVTAAPWKSMRRRLRPRRHPRRKPWQRKMQPWRSWQLVNGGAPELSVEEGRVRGVFFSAPIPPAVGADPVVQATWVLTTYNVFGLPDPLTDSQFAGRSADNQHLFFDQVQAGLPVFPRRGCAPGWG